MKICKDCNVEKPAEEYWAASSTPDKLFTYCKPCAKARNAAYHDENFEAVRTRHLAKRCWTPAQSDAAWVSQGGECAICREGMTRSRLGGNGRKSADAPTKHVNSSGRTAHHDHNDETKQPRALLCHFCNTALGKFHHDPQLLRQAANYLEHHA